MEKLELQKIAKRKSAKDIVTAVHAAKSRPIRADLYQQQIYSHICILKK